MSTYLNKYFKGWAFKRRQRISDGASIISIEIPGPNAASNVDVVDAEGRDEVVRFAAGVLHACGLIDNDIVRKVAKHLEQEPTN